ncbi:hypothetical protein AB833_27485 [Chromatiales bacterium (ex Bugula neritina AB1)]|nr:hypothetical protein AB833_27485 [Chromatiales bacterium (ex Bugula neritina AB1)]
MSWSVSTALKLGRVSNLPTVWSNTLAGVVLAGASPFNWNIVSLTIAMTAAYIGGMFLNDAFDRKIDAKERPERPIPSGEVKAGDVYAAGFTLLGAAIMFSALAAYGWGHSVLRSALIATALCAAIVLYNAWHKNNPLSPVVMGACRMLVYLCAGFTAMESPSFMLYAGAIVLLAYLIGLTYVAKQENLGTVKNMWPLVFLAAPALFGIYALIGDTQILLALVAFNIWIIYCLYLIQRKESGDIPKAVVSMIAGISLVDAIFIASTSSLSIMALALIAFAFTLFLQRYISGT